MAHQYFLCKGPWKNWEWSLNDAAARNVDTVRWGTEASSGPDLANYNSMNNGDKVFFANNATDPGPFVDLDIKCSGRSPWLSEDTEPCFTDGKETVVRGIHIRAPSLWYSTRMSALKVPRWLHPVNRKLDDPKDAGQLRAAISKLRQNGNSFEKIIGILQTDFKDISDQILEQKTK